MRRPEKPPDPVKLSHSKVLATVAVLWKGRQANIVIDTEHDCRGIQEILEQGKRTIRVMIHNERSHIRRPH